MSARKSQGHSQRLNAIKLAIVMLAILLLISGIPFSRITLSANGTRDAAPATVVAVNGEVFKLEELAGDLSVARVETAQPVFKVFGFSSDNRRLLYTSLRNRIPTGELYVEDLSTNKAQRVTPRLVMSAAWSPDDDNQIAYTFARGDGFGLAVVALDSGVTRILVEDKVFADQFKWDRLRQGVDYFETTDLQTGTQLSARFVPAALSDETKRLPTMMGTTGFPTLDPSAMVSGGINSFRVTARDGVHEVLGENLLGSGLISARDLATGSTTHLAKGQLLEVLRSGVVVRAFFPNSSNVQFVDWSGGARNIGSSVVSYNLPLQTADLIQGGSGYGAPGSCNISSHTGNLAFAYDFQNLNVGAHAMAAADGLVVFTTSSVTCNTIDTDCPDYQAGGCSGTYLGNVAIIQHADGTYTAYAHMQLDSLQVTIGTQVCQGLYLGRQGHTGSTSGTFNGCGDHLHFQRQASPDIFGQSVAVDFSDTPSNPLTCGVTYSSASAEVSHSISPASQTFGVSGGADTVAVTSTGCTWTATSNDSWITIDFAGSGSGNDLVSYSVADNSASGPRTGSMNIAGHVFTVTQDGGGVTNQAPTVNAGTDQTITLPNAAALAGTASDDSLPNPPATLSVTWSQVSGPGSASFANGNALNTNATFDLAGVYVLRLTADDGALSSSDDVTITVDVSGAGGVLSGSQTSPPSSISLTTEGVADWAHWGLTTAASFDHKNGVTSQISNYTQIGVTNILRYTNNPNSFSWSDGIPTGAATNSATGVYVYGIGNGFQLILPADTTDRTLKLYVGVWSAQGRLEATLSDGSASPLVDTSLSNQSATSTRVVTLDYRAATSGQTLTINWTVASSSHPQGNVTLQAASLILPNSPPANQAPVTNAGPDQTVTLPAGATLTGVATDDGLPNPPATLTTTWSMVSGPGTVTFGNVGALSTVASFSGAGIYVVRLTADDGALQTSDDLTIVANNSSGAGVLTGSNASTPANVNLTTEGSADWAHWGLTAPTSLNHKIGVTSQISNYAALGNGVVQRYTNSPNLFNWTDGTPTASANNTATGIYVIGLDNGFQLTLPADAMLRTLKLYVGLWAAGGRLEASLSDASAPAFVDTSLLNSSGTSNALYTLNYQAGSNGQTVTIKWTVSTVFNNWSNVTLQAATLQTNGGPPPNQAPVVDAGANQNVTLPNTASLAGSATDDGLPNPPAALTTTWSKVSGPGTVSFANESALSTTASFGAAGTFVLRLTADDGALTSSGDVTINVFNSGGTGSLVVSAVNSPTNVSLTTEGTADWAHWGLTTASSFNHKGGVTQQISNYSKVGVGVVQRFANNSILYDWSDGTPSASANSSTGLYVIGLNNGFQVTAPADSVPRTLKLYVGLWAAGGRLEASLSDASAPVYVDTSLVNSGATSNAVYTLTYHASGAGQTLSVKWTVNTTFNNWSNVTLQAATLVDGGGAPPPPASEFQISSSPPSAQLVTHTAADANGNFIVVWQSNPQDGSASGIFARRYDAAGLPLGNEFQVNTYTLNNQYVPNVAIDAAGNFVIVWESEGQDGSAYGVYAQRYDAAGVPLGGEFRVNSTTLNTQYDSVVAMAPDGKFVIVWVSDQQDGSQTGIFAQRFDSSGVPHGGEFQVNSYTSGSQDQPKVSIDANGNFLIVWGSDGQDGSGYGIFGQRYDLNGVPQGAEFQVNTSTISDQFEMSSAMAASGNFIVVWASTGQDGSGKGVYGQRYNAAGIPQGGEFQINSYTTSDQEYPFIAIDAGEEFVVVWESRGQDGSGEGIYGQRFDALGFPQGSEFQVNTYSTNDQLYPFTARSGNGNFVVTWSSYGQDGYSYGVFGKRYDASGNALPVP